MSNNIPSTPLVPITGRDAQVIDLWLHGRPLHTQRAYRADARALLAFAGKPLPQLTLADLQAYADSIADQADSSKARRLAVVKSLLRFAHQMGYLPVDVGRPLRLPRRSERLAERIMPEAAVHRLFALERDRRNHAVLRVLYATGARVSELCGMRWRHLATRGKGGQVTLHGKGDKERTVLLPPSIWEELLDLRGPAYARHYPSPDAPVFRSRNGRPLSVRRVHQLVRKAAQRAGLPAEVSPHWLRHAHASHSLSRGCPIHLVQATLGHASIATTGRYLHAMPDESSSTYLAV